MAKKDLWIAESPIDMVVGETITFSIEWEGITTVSSPTATVYFNGTDVTSTVMASGSHAATDNVQTLKPITTQSAHKNGSYVVNIQASADGNTEIKLLEIRVKDPVKTQ